MGLNGTTAAEYCSLNPHAPCTCARVVMTQHDRARAHGEREAGELTREREDSRARGGASERPRERQLARDRIVGERTATREWWWLRRWGSVCCVMTSRVA